MSGTIAVSNRESFSNAPARDRIMPQALEAEQSTIGAMLMEAAAIDEVTEILGRDDFYREIHRKIFTAVTAIHNRNEKVDLIAVVEELRRAGCLDDVGGTAYVLALIEACPSSANVKKYAGAVKRTSQLRQILRTAEQLQSHAYGDDADPEQIIDHAGQVFHEMTLGAATGGLVGAGTIADDSMARLKARIESPNHIVGLPTGLHDLDKLTLGLKPSELVILAARPKMGKSALLMQVAWNVAFTENKPVMVFSLEMSSGQLMDRMICHVAGVESHKSQTGYLSRDEQIAMDAAAFKIKSVPMFFDDAAGLSVFQMMTRIRRVAMKHPPALIVVDYLQLAASGQGKNSRVEEVDAIANGLAAISKQFQCPVLAAAQLSRAVEQREDKRPMLSDLRESGGLEATANVVAFMFRPGYYTKDHEDPTTEIIIAANRSGSPGTAKVDFWPGQSKFVSRANEREFEHYANRI